MSQKGKYFINTVGQLNYMMIEKAAGAISSDLMSPEMNALWSTYSKATQLGLAGEKLAAINTYIDLLAKWPDFIPGYHDFSLELLESGDVEGALQQVRIAEYLAPNWHRVHMTLATIFDVLGDTESELAEYQKALKSHPTYCSAMINTAIVYMNLGELHKAKTWYLKALMCVESDMTSMPIFAGNELNQKRQRILMDLSNIATLEAQFTEGEYWLVKALEREPANKELIMRLAILREHMSETNSSTLANDDFDEDDFDDLSDEGQGQRI